MSVEKVVENGITYRIETTEQAAVKLQAPPQLMYDAPPQTAQLGDVITIPLRLEDFDGERRNDSQTLTFVIHGQLVEVPMENGELTLELELAARGRQRITSATPMIGFAPIEIEVL